MNRVLRFLSWTFALVWAVLAAVSMLFMLPAGRSPDGPVLFGHRFMVVLTDSMQPALNAGDLLIGRSPGGVPIQPGYVITFRSPGTHAVITHRVVQVDRSGPEVRFSTKGDAASDADPELVPSSSVLTTFRFRIPAGGYLVTFARSWYGLVILILIPCGVLMGTEASRLVRLLRWQKRQKDADQT